MKEGPVSSGYLGTPVVLIGAVFIAFVLSRILVSAYYRRHDASLKEDRGKIVFVVGVGVYVLGSFLWEIWKHT